MKINVKWFPVLVLAAAPMVGKSDVMLGPGDTYTYSFTQLEDSIWLSPGLPPEDDYSFKLYLSGQLYNNPPDNIRIRLYEEPDDLVPEHTIFGESVPNLTVKSSQISMIEVPGTLWFDRTGRVEVEVLAGRINVDYMIIDLGPGLSSSSAYIEAIPEPNSLALAFLGTGGLLYYRRTRRRDAKALIKTPPTCNQPIDREDVF